MPAVRPTAMLARAATVGVALLVLGVACSGGESSSSEAKDELAMDETSCTLTRRYQHWGDDEPASDVSVALADGGAMARTDERGRFSFDAGTRESVVVRVTSDVYLRDITNRRGNRGSSEIPSGVAEVTYALDTEGCDPDGDPTNCWIDVACAAANPPGFDPMSRDEKVATMIHAIGHALGLGHALICGATVMWADADCASSNRPVVGEDDIASLNELLGVTLAALRGAR